MATLRFGLGLFLAVASGCTSSPSDVGDAATPDAAQDNASGDAGLDSDASSTNTDGGSTSSPPYQGWVYFSDRSNSQSTLYEAFGSFANTSVCSGGSSSGNCCYGPIPATTTSLNAGTLTLADGATALGQLTFGSSSYSVLASSITPSFKWTTGDSLSVTATGDSSGVSAFSGSVIAPSALANVSPAFGGPTINVSTSSDYTVSFTAASGGNQVRLEANTSANYVYCEGATSSGAISLPHALLGTLSGSGIIEIYTFNVTTVTSSNAAVNLYATKGELNQYVTFQ